MSNDEEAAQELSFEEIAKKQKRHPRFSTEEKRYDKDKKEDWTRGTDIISGKREHPKGRETRIKAIKKEEKEAIETLRLRERRDPLGQVDNLYLVVNGDYHLPIAETGDVREDFRPVSWVADQIAAISRKRAEKGKIAKEDVIEENWWWDRAYRLLQDTFVVHMGALKGQLENFHRRFRGDSKEEQEPEGVTKFLAVDLGDKEMPGGSASDVSLVARMLAESVSVIKDKLGRPRYNEKGQKIPLSEAEKQDTYAIFLTGGHDVDFDYHGPDRLVDEDRIYGFPYFSQRVGGEDRGGYLVVGVCTPFFDEKLEKELEDMEGVGKAGEAWDIWQKVKEEQKEFLLEAAKVAEDEGRQVVLMGHEALVLNKLARGKDGKKDEETLEGIFPDVTNIMAGHYHRRIRKLKLPFRRNNSGNPIYLSIPGIPVVGAYGIMFDAMPTMNQAFIEPGKEVEINEMKENPKDVRGLY